MTTLHSIEIKAFVPARDYALSQRFYADLGFEQNPTATASATSSTANAASCCRTSIIRNWRKT